MRFASIGGQSNYAQAGKAVAKDAAKIFDVARKNSVDFGGLAEAAMETRSNEKIASIRAGAQVAKANVSAQKALKIGEMKADGKRKAGVVAAAGMVGLGIGERVAGKEKKADYSSYTKRADKARAEAAEFRAQGDAISTDFKPATTETNAGGTAVSGKAETPSASSTPVGNQASTPSASGGALNFASVKDHATKAGAKYPELVAAQWALESGYGKSPSGTNNYFGIKATSGESATSHKTWEVRNGQDVTETARFKNFDTPQGSINEVVSKWHKNYGSYSGVNNAASAHDAADMLRQQGYATDPAYSRKLQQIMKDNS